MVNRNTNKKLYFSKKAQDYGQGNVTFLGFGLTLGLDRAFPEGIFMGVAVFAQFLSIGTMMTDKVSYRAYNNCYWSGHLSSVTVPDPPRSQADIDNNLVIWWHGGTKYIVAQTWLGSLCSNKLIIVEPAGSSYHLIVDAKYSLDSNNGWLSRCWNVLPRAGGGGGGGGGGWGRDK